VLLASFALAAVTVTAVTAVSYQPQTAVSPSPEDAVTLCGEPVTAPPQLPPVGSAPMVYMLGLCFPTEDNVSIVSPETYLYYVKLRPSRPSAGEWVAFDESVLETVRQDFKRLWDTGFLEDLRIEADDYVFANGVVGKVISYYMQERQRIRLIEYDTPLLDRSKIDEALANRGITLRSDGFLDEGTIGRVSRVLRELLAEKGYVEPEISHTVTPGPSETLVNVTFRARPGPRLAIRDIEFVGNHAIPDAALTSKLKGNRPENLFSFATGVGAFNEDKFGDDAQRVIDHYRDRGFIEARVGQPELRRLDENAAGTVRWIQLRIPITEGTRYRLGTVSVEGNMALPTETLEALFKAKSGEWYVEERFREGIRQARELYGGAGYIEFTAFPDLRPRGSEPIVDVVLRVTEGPQYRVHRLTFAGNTTTHDVVLRRELPLLEGGVFSAEALKYGIRRLNQLGYFKPIEGTDRDVKVDKAAGIEDSVDVTVTVEEQNRNQVQFGAGVSQYEGVFGSLSYTTANFLGRGESLTLSGQTGQRASSYQLAFNEPYLFSQRYSAGFDLYSRKVNFVTGDGVLAYSEVRSGSAVSVGRPLFRFSRATLGYGYEVIDTAASQSALNSLSASSSLGVPLFNADIDEGRHTESRITPIFSHNSVDSPIMPHTGNRLSLSLPLAGGLLGGTTNYVKVEADAAKFISITRRTGFGLHAAGGAIRRYGSTPALPYYTRYFLGGETQIRGVNLRTVGPVDRSTNRAIGGDRFVLFNAEYYVDLFGPVRALAFHDAGQAYAEQQPLDLRQLRTSSGFELRVLMPMLNVPFRLIYAWNIYRDAFQPARGFKFAVGTTF
jgi:outer membrane protein insertion porin family